MFEVVQEKYFPASGATRSYSDGGKVVATFEFEESADNFIKELRSKLPGDIYVFKREAKEVKEEKMSTKITAEEARKLAGPSVEEYVDEVYTKIREAATSKKREVVLRHEPWARGGYDKTDEWAEACDMLEAEGFRVSFFYEERQFVDMGTKVEW